MSDFNLEEILYADIMPRVYETSFKDGLLVEFEDFMFEWSDERAMFYPRGVYTITTIDDVDWPVRIAMPMEVLCYSVIGGSHHLVLSCTTFGGKSARMTIPAELLVDPDELVRVLLRGGAAVEPMHGKDIARYLASYVIDGSSLEISGE